MPHIENVQAVKTALRELKDRYGEETHPTVFVGFTQNYAIWVHETDRDYRVGQWKYLSSAARDLSSELARIIRDSMQAGSTMLQGLLRAGLRLQAEAQERCPIDTSALKASAFTATIGDLEEEAGRAHAQSESIRQSSGGGKK